MSVLFLGTIDDKSIEYPYGGYRKVSSYSDTLIFHHILFSETNTPILLEEGFLLASQESLYPYQHGNILLDAVRFGLLKVASRYSDIEVYGSERRELKHPSPPDSKFGKQYLRELQEACVSSDAFYNYPIGDVDRLTYERFRHLYGNDDYQQLFASFEADLPLNFLNIFEIQYLEGNNGKQWTARSAWESSAQLVFRNYPDIKHALMCIANRERQIIRGAAFAVENKIEVKVETGFSNDKHFLIGLNSDQKECLYSDPDNFLQAKMPKVEITTLKRHSKIIFPLLANKYSRLSILKQLYLDSLRRLECKWDTAQIEEFELASLDYEKELYRACKINPAEDTLPARLAVNATLGVVTSACVYPLLNHLEKQYDKEKQVIFRDSSIKRRAFLKSCMFGLLATGSLTEIKGGELATSLIRKARDLKDDDTADIGKLAGNSKQLFHQQLEIDVNAANRFFNPQ